MQIVQEATAFADQANQGTLSIEILTVLLQVLRKVVDTIGKQCDLAFSRSGIFSRFAVRGEDFALLFRI